jgi:hypothetical protein
MLVNGDVYFVTYTVYGSLLTGEHGKYPVGFSASVRFPLCRASEAKELYCFEELGC